MRKQVALMLMLILGLAIPHIASGYSGVQKPAVQIPQNIVLQNPANPNDQCDGQDPQEQSERCCGQDPIVLNGLSIVAEDKLQDALTNYSDLSASTYYSTQGIKTFNSLRDRYELCFDIQNDHVKMESTLNIANVGGETKGMAVYDLKVQPEAALLQAGNPVVSVNYTVASVELIDLSMTNLNNGLLITGNDENTPARVNLINATINGSGQGGGSCVDLNFANDSLIQGGTITGCDIGVKIRNSDPVIIGAPSAAEFATKRVLITNHLQHGILVESGDNVKFSYNLIHDIDFNDPSHEDAVALSGSANDFILPPIMSEDPDGGENKLLDCKYDSENQLFSRIARFDNLPGSVDFYISGDLFHQAREYFFSCELGSDGICDLTAVNLGNSCGAPDDNMFFVTAIYTDGGSSALMQPVPFDGDVIFAESGGVDVPTAPADVESGEDVTVTSGQASADGGGGGSEMAAMGAKGGCMGGGSSLLPNDISSTYAPHLGAWWIIFSIVFLASMRVVKVRNRRLRK